MGSSGVVNNRQEKKEEIDPSTYQYSLFFFFWDGNISDWCCCCSFWRHNSKRRRCKVGKRNNPKRIFPSFFLFKDSHNWEMDFFYLPSEFHFPNHIFFFFLLYFAEDNLRQLHGIQESIQRMRQVSVQTLRLQVNTSPDGGNHLVDRKRLQPFHWAP